MKKLFLLLLFPIFLFSSINILPQSEIYIDKNYSYTIKNIQDAGFKAFETLGTKKINLGYTSDTVWLKFSLSNPASKPIKKLLVIDNQMLENISLYTKNNSYYDKKSTGIFVFISSQSVNRELLNFYFNIELKANETKYFYIETSSLTSALFFNIELMDKDELITKEFNQQAILIIFFTSLVTLIIYNLFILIFTRDVIYLYYILYLTFVIINHLSYTNMIIYLVNKDFLEIDAYLSIFYLAGISIFAILFTMRFLNVKKYKKLYILFWTVIGLNIACILITSPKFYPIDIIAALILFGLILIVLTSYYLLYKKEENAKFFVLGWSIVLVGWIMLATYNYGYYSILERYPYFYEISMFLEAVLFSISLSSRLNKTKELEQQVNKNSILTKELHHRVKNNMQFIISLYRLKLNKNINNEVNEKLKDIENSIKAMSNIHEILYEREDLENIDTNKYFKTLVDEIQNTYQGKNVQIFFDCNTNLEIQQAIYCGIILNELVTNSFKYAFEKNGGHINILLENISNKNTLIIEDNGNGYDINQTSNGFGLELVKSLIENELRGNIKMDTLNKTRYEIIF